MGCQTTHQVLAFRFWKAAKAEFSCLKASCWEYPAGKPEVSPEEQGAEWRGSGDKDSLRGETGVQGGMRGLRAEQGSLLEERKGLLKGEGVLRGEGFREAKDLKGVQGKGASVREGVLEGSRGPGSQRGQRSREVIEKKGS